jgi:predicted nucleic acid-binding protein
VTWLLDSNVLVALAVADHVHHDLVVSWFIGRTDTFATTPMTQGALLRYLLRTGIDTGSALQVLGGITAHDRHSFWRDELPFTARTLRGVVGHRQVTDGYLADQARANRGRLATLDRGIAALHRDVAELITSGEPTPPASGR